MIEKAEYHFNNGQYEVALELYEDILQDDPKNSEAWFGKGRALYELKKRMKALSAFQKAAKLNPELRYHLFYEKGKALALKRKYNQAYEMFDIALKIKPDFHEIYLNKGAIELERKNYDLAEELFDKALELNPTFHEAQFYKDRVKEIKSEGIIVENFEIDFDNLFDEDTSPLEGIYSSSELENKKKEDKSSFKDKEKSEEWLTKGLTLKMLGNSSEALKFFEKAIESDDTNFKAWYNKALVLNSINNTNDALIAINEALRIDSKNIEVKELLKKLTK